MRFAKMQSPSQFPLTSAPSPIPSASPSAAPIITLSPSLSGQFLVGEQTDYLVHTAGPRGYSFRAPCSFKITSLQVLGINGSESDSQSAYIFRSKNKTFEQFPDNTNISNPNTDVEVLLAVTANASVQMIYTDLHVQRGDYIGVLGYRGEVPKRMSYGITPNVSSTVCGGAPLRVTRFLSQQVKPPYTELSEEAGNNLISRINFHSIANYVETSEPTISPTTCVPTPMSFSPSSSPSYSPTMSPQTCAFAMAAVVVAAGSSISWL